LSAEPTSYQRGSVTDIEPDVELKQKPKLKSIAEVDPELLRTFDKLGVASRSALFSTA